MNQMQAQVTEFHEAMELPARTVPSTLSKDERALRANLILEETTEVLDALGFLIEIDETGTPQAVSHGSPYHHHPSLQVKELCDLLYVVFGTAVTMGVDLQPFFTLVHENNMTKVGGEIRADGKRLKPPGYRPIDLTTELRRHAFENCHTCQDYNGDGPPHFASIRCESGGYNHCSCDVCF